MKIILLNPACKQGLNNRYERYYIRSGSRWPHSGVKLKGTIPHYLPFPFFLAYAAALLKKSGFDVYMIDAVALDISEDDLLARISNIKPEFVFYEVTTPTVDYDLLLAMKIKSVTDTTIIIGGAHPTVFALQILKENKFIDFVLKGEYELTILELIKSLRGKSPNFPLGVVFRNGKEIIDKGYPEEIYSLDRLPPPLRGIFPTNDRPNPTIYWDGFCQYQPAIQMQSSRGCAYKCYFCIWSQVIYNNARYRTFSGRRVVDEMQYSMYTYKAREIYFDDDDFTIDRNHIFSICEEIAKRSLKIKWSCMGSATNLSNDILEIMAKSGCIGIKFGVESGSKKVLKTIGKPVDLKKIKDIIKSCKKFGIKTHATFMVGLLEETEEDIKKTIKFADSLDVDSIQISIATPFPGTEFFKVAKEKGLLNCVDWRKYDGKRSEAIQLSNLEGVKIESIRIKFFISWFLKRLLSPVWWFGHFYIIFRTIKGLGVRFFLKQIIFVVIDEQKNR